MKSLIFGAIGMLITSSAIGDPDSAVQAFARHLSQWRSINASDYVYEMRRICECGTGSSALVKIVVRDGIPFSMTYAESSEHLFGDWPAAAREQVTEFTVGEPLDRELWQAYPSVHELFGIIAAALAEPAWFSEVHYDEHAGYPVKATIDPHELIADVRRTYVVQNLRPLDPIELP